MKKVNKLSIITINFNNAIGLEKTINSIIAQSDSNFEYIIIDGDSDDNSIEIIKKNEQYLSHWISEPDTGIYNAMNKGIVKAKGDYLLFLNSGDYLASDDIVAKFNNFNCNRDIISGDLILKNSDESNKHISISPEIITIKYLINKFLPHPSTFIKKELFDKIGLYNENNFIVSDWEFFLKAFVFHNVIYQRIPVVISVFVTDGISSNPKYAIKINEEREKVLNQILPYIHLDYKELFKLEKEKDAYLKSEEYKAILILKRMLIISILKKLLRFHRKLAKMI